MRLSKIFSNPRTPVRTNKSYVMKPFDKNITNILVSGGVGVIPTDTIYGLVGRAEMPSVVEKIYRIRKRNLHKPCIILISSYEDLKKFNIEISSKMRLFLETRRLWPGKVSIVFPSTDPRFEYLTRGTNGLSFRMPDIPELRDLLAQTGPLVAPSANREGDPPATTAESARAYFKDSVDFYVDGEELHGLPSTLIQIVDDEVVVLREGAVTF